MDNVDKDRREVTPLSDLDKAMEGLAGTPKEEVDAEEERQRAKKQERDAKDD